MPITPFMGVRISWLMLARNSLFARVAASAASRAAPMSSNMFTEAICMSCRARRSFWSSRSLCSASASLSVSLARWSANSAPPEAVNAESLPSTSRLIAYIS